MIELIPSLLVSSQAEFERRLRLVEQSSLRTVHVDVLDGTLFPEMSWFEARAVGAIETPIAFELHLMVENPLPIIAQWKSEVKTLKRVIIHVELDRPISTLLEDIKQWHELETGLALNPETPIETIKHHTTMLDYLLIMGVHPGASGQKFLGEMILQKIKDLHLLYPSFPIGCDGGLTPEIAPRLIEAGCSRLIAASSIFKSPDPLAAMNSFVLK